MTCCIVYVGLKHIVYVGLVYVRLKHKFPVLNRVTWDHFPLESIISLASFVCPLFWRKSLRSSIVLKASLYVLIEFCGSINWSSSPSTSLSSSFCSSSPAQCRFDPLGTSSSKNLSCHVSSSKSKQVGTSSGPESSNEKSFPHKFPALNRVTWDHFPLELMQTVHHPNH